MADILVAGIYMADRLNSASHLVAEFARSGHQVEQRWIALALESEGACALPFTVDTVRVPTGKFQLLNRITHDAAHFDWVVLCDDDVELEANFLDRFVELAVQCDFSLAQPARTNDSFVDHTIVRQMPGIRARQTRFVEIGPVTMLQKEAIPLLLPFDDHLGMGWGLDFIWPAIIDKAGLRMGIIDAVPIAHRIRPSVTGYSMENAYRMMAWALARHDHLAYDQAMSIVEVFT